MNDFTEEELNEIETSCKPDTLQYVNGSIILQLVHGVRLWNERAHQMLREGLDLASGLNESALKLEDAGTKYMEKYEAALLQIEELREELRKVDGHGEYARVTRDKAISELQESNRLISAKDKAMALLVERLRGLLPHRGGTMPCDGPGCGFCDDEESQEPEKRKCLSTYSHGTHGKLTCEKDADHLNRIGDVEHYSRNTKWMSM